MPRTNPLRGRETGPTKEDEMGKPSIEQAREELNRWEYAAANDAENQHYVQAVAKAKAMDFVDVYDFLINEQKAGQLRAWGFSEEDGLWEFDATKTQSHMRMEFEGEPIAVATMRGFIFAPPEVLAEKSTAGL